MYMCMYMYMCISLYLDLYKAAYIHRRILVNNPIHIVLLSSDASTLHKWRGAPLLTICHLPAAHLDHRCLEDLYMSLYSYLKIL